jgi:hypothetical protein
VIEADEARALLASRALLLDTRGQDLSDAQPLPSSVPVVWQDFTNSDLPNMGQILADAVVLTEKLRAVGVSTTVPVTAVADTARGWGDNGRIV